MKDYIIIWAWNAAQLEKKVEDKIKEGYLIYGFPFGNERKLYQGMIYPEAPACYG